MPRGHIRQRSKGSWTIVLSAGVDPATNRRRRIWRTVRGTKRQAEVELSRLLAEYDHGITPATGRLTVREYLDTWLRDVVTQRNRPRTIESYSSLVRHHINTTMGNVVLHELEPRHVDHMTTAIRAKGLTLNTALHAFTVLRKALRDAERRGLVSRNVCHLVDAPRIEPYRVDPPDMEALAAILAEAHATKYGPVFHFMACTGIRRGEAVALKWRSADLDRGVAAITESAQRLSRRGVVIQPTKSAAGRRGIDLDATTIALLGQHRARQAEHILGLGRLYEDRGLVFPGPLGLPVNPDNLSRGFKVVARRAGFPGVRLHDLRHAHAAGLIKAGVHPRVVQERLGHSSAAFTLQVYGHVMAGLQAAAASAFAELLATAAR